MRRNGCFETFALLVALAGSGAQASSTGSCPFVLPIFINDTTTVSCSFTQTFTTEITARMQGGPLLFDETFSLPFADASVQAAILSAEGLLTGARALFLTGPTLTSQQTSFLNDVSTVIGPATALFGNIGTCQGVTPHVLAGDQLYTPFGCPPPGTCVGAPVSLGPQLDPNVDSYLTGCPPTGGVPLSVAAGDINVNTNVDTQLTQVYELDGFTSVPEPGSCLLLSTGVLFLAMWSRRRGMICDYADSLDACFRARGGIERRRHCY